MIKYNCPNCKEKMNIFTKSIFDYKCYNCKIAVSSKIYDNEEWILIHNLCEPIFGSTFEECKKKWKLKAFV